MQEKEILICSICNEKFINKSVIIWHMLNIHKNEPSVQDIHKRKQQNYLKSLRHTNKKFKVKDKSKKSTVCKKIRKFSKEYKCDKCDYKSVHLTTYNRHLLIHEQGTKVHKCKYCSYSAIQPYNLQRHIKDVHPLGPAEPIIICKIQC